MARARPGLAKAVHEILERCGSGGRRLSYRQAERRTGLSPATIGELAKGNARTVETVRRFALGMNEEPERLLLLAGFVPEDNARTAHASCSASNPNPSGTPELDPEARECLARWSVALARFPAGPERDLFLDRLRCDAELLERFAERYRTTTPPQRMASATELEDEEDSC